MAQTFYDEIAYPGRPFVQTHPDRLAVIARLFGHRTKDVASCRMLEVGCGDGANLIAMAVSLPYSEFVGIDLSQNSIARGKAVVRQLGLRNVSLRAADLNEFSGGSFDYIAAHGIYSWVPPQVREGLLALVARSLRADGVAMISYAVYPGAYIEQLVRAPMRFCRMTDPAAVKQFVESIFEQAPSPALRALYREEYEKIKTLDDGFFRHDQLAEYTPVTFTQFAQHAGLHGLHYLGEANLGEAVDLRDPALEPVRQFAQGERIAAEQYMDHAKCRRFRQTILGQSPANGIPEATALRGCFAAAPGYLAASGLLALDAAWPAFVACDDLDPELLLRLFATGRVEIRTSPPQIGSAATVKPRATALARMQAASARAVTNLIHHSVVLEDEFTRTFLAALDGRRTRQQIIDEFARRSNAPDKVAPEIDKLLAMLAHHALLAA